MRAERERHPRPHAVQTESSFRASAKHGAQGTAGESGENRPAYRIDPGAPSGDVELGVRAPRGTSAATVETASGNKKRPAKPRQVVHWHVLQETEELVRKLEGVYLLRTNVAGTDAGQVWEDYVTLVRVENAFRTLKHDLALRPVCHHLEERAEAHVLFCWIAYAMYWVLERTHR